MDEVDLDTCLQDNCWLCPVEGCAAKLSRKQTLQNHLQSLHGIHTGNLCKKYKLYNQDASIPIPRTTMYYHSRKNEKSLCHDAAQPQEKTPAINQDFNDDLEMPELFICHEECVPFINEEDNLDTIFIDDDMEEETGESSTSDSESDSDNGACMPSSCSAAPLFVIPPSSGTVHSKLSHIDHALVIAAFASRHNLSDTAMNHLIQLINLHFIPIHHIMETNIDRLKQMCGFDEQYMMHHSYCNICKKLFSLETENCQTPGCNGNSNNPKSRSYFVTGNVEIQIREVLQRNGVWESVQLNRSSQTTSTSCISDIYDGSEYRRIQEDGQFLENKNNISLIAFTDGFPLFKSSSVALWPVYLTINELSPKQRFTRKNMILWGLWQGQGKPKMNMFLRPLVIDIKKLYCEGMTIKMAEEKITVKAMLAVFTMDLQARAYILNMTQHNGAFSCVFCLEPGKTVNSGKGTCRSFPFRNDPVATRTIEGIRRCAQEAQTTRTTVEGFQGETVLFYLPGFNVTKNVVIDYMHGILIGVTKKLLHLWFDASSNGQDYCIRPQLDDVNLRLEGIKPPYMMNRLSKLTQFIHWKASEMRSWLLYYSIPCLLGSLPSVYVDHFSYLVEATYLLLTQGITKDDLNRARHLMLTFVRFLPQLYEENVMGINVHNLIHIVDCVEMWGPLWAWSCFAFESFNGEIRKGCHGKGNVCRQIFWNLQAQKRIEAVASSEEHCSDEEIRAFLQKMINSSAIPKGQEAYQCQVVRPQQLPKTFKLPSSPLLEGKETTGFLRAAKIIRNSFVMFSRMCSKVKRRNSHTILLQQPQPDGTAILDVDFFLLHEKSKHVYAVGRRMRSAGNALPGHVPHIQKLEYISQQTVVLKAEDLMEPIIIMRLDSRLFYSVMPNHVERD